MLEHTVCHLRIAQTKTSADRHRGNGHEGCVSVDVMEAAVQHTSVIAGRTVPSVDELKRKRNVRYFQSSKSNVLSFKYHVTICWEACDTVEKVSPGQINDEDVCIFHRHKMHYGFFMCDGPGNGEEGQQVAE